jgi:hypothetical protein
MLLFTGILLFMVFATPPKASRKRSAKDWDTLLQSVTAATPAFKRTHSGAMDPFKEGSLADHITLDQEGVSKRQIAKVCTPYPGRANAPQHLPGEGTIVATPAGSSAALCLACTARPPPPAPPVR